MRTTFRKPTTRSLLFYCLLFCILNSPALAQSCQGSFDNEDGELPYVPREKFICGSGRMEEQRWMEQRARELKGFYDIEGFTCYGQQGYFQKNNQLYYSPHPDTFRLIPNGDVSTLEFVGNFVRDKNAVYSRGIAQKDIEHSSFQLISDAQYATDGRYVFYNSSRLNHLETDRIQVVEGADVSSFRLFDPNNDHPNHMGYAKDAEHVYYLGKQIKEADLQTFKIAQGGYAHDDHFVYHLGIKVDGSSGSTFKEIDYMYSCDENQVYFYGQIIPNMKGKTFALIGQSGLGSDGRYVCYGATILENADPDTFVNLGCGYEKDANQVYFRGYIMPEFDPQTFETIEWGYVKDKNGVYCDNGLIPGANPAKFVTLGKKYGKDEEHVYYLRTRLDDCLPASFVADPLDPNKGEDALAVYNRGARSLK